MHRVMKAALRVVSYKLVFLAGVYVGASFFSDDRNSTNERYDLLENRVDRIENRLEYIELGRRQNAR